jgi:hypothetical protein
MKSLNLTITHMATQRNVEVMSDKFYLNIICTQVDPIKFFQKDDVNDDDDGDDDNSIKFLFICVPTQQPKGQLQG